MIRKYTLQPMGGPLSITRLFLLIFLSSFSLFSYAVDFSVHASKNWRKISQSGENAIYKDSQSKSNETVILQSFRAQEKDADLLHTMTSQKLTEARTRLMASFGLGNYTVLDISRPPIKNSSVKGIVFIESLFRDLQNRDVQMVERQYLANGKMYIVTYLVDAPAIENRKRIDKILNDFRPKFSSFVSANSEDSLLDPSMIKDELLQLLNRSSQCILPNAFGDEIADSSTSTVNNSNTNSAVAASIIGDRPLTASEISQQCNNVPVNKRRTAQDTSFSALAKTALTSPKSCIMGIADNAWGIVKGAYDMAAAGVKYTFDSSYRSEVNSTVGVVVAEIKKDPKAFAQRIAAEVYNSAKQMVGDYFACLKPSEQIRSFCNLASNLIPAGILAKIVTKAPLTEMEVAKVAKLAKKAVDVEKTAVAKVADEVPTMHEASVATKAANASSDASTVSKSASDVTSADKTSTFANDDDRINRAQQALGRDLSPAEQQAVSDAHEVGSGQIGRNGYPAAIGNYTDAQLRDKTETLKDAGFNTSERRALIENGVVGAQPAEAASSRVSSPFISYVDGNGDRVAAKVVGKDSSGGVAVQRFGTDGRLVHDRIPASQTSTIRDSATAKLALERTGDPRIDNFRNAYVAKNFSGKNAYISYIDKSTNSRLPAKVLRELSDGSLEVEVPGSNGSLKKIISKDDLTQARLSDTSSTHFQSLETTPGHSVKVGQSVNVPRSNASISNGTDKKVYPDGHAKVQFRDGDNLYEKKVESSDLKPPAPAKIASSTEHAVNQYSKDIDSIAPLFDRKTKSGDYISNGYWREWLGIDTDKIPQQGWKLHVGATANTAGRIAKLLVPELEKKGISFKIVDDLKRFAARNPATDTQAGKFITVYPKDANEAASISRLISNILKNHGFKSSDFLDAPGEGRAGLGVSYRYGRLTGGDLIDPRTGRAVPNSENLLLTPDGRFVDDQRGIIAPSWVSNPFD